MASNRPQEKHSVGEEPPIHILIAEDNPLVLNTYTRIMKRFKPQEDVELILTFVEDGLKAMDVFTDEDKKNPDGIITDFDMPNANGGQLAEFANNEGPNTPVVVITGKLDVHAPRLKDLLNVLETHSKPIGVSELRGIVNRLIDQILTNRVEEPTLSPAQIENEMAFAEANTVKNLFNESPHQGLKSEVA